MTAKPFLIIAILLSFVSLTLACVAYTPHLGDRFSFYEVKNLGNGSGNYNGYSERTIVNGTEMVNGIIENGIVPFNYSFLWTWSNSTGGTNSGKVSGNFTFSSLTFLYVKGTDNQTGYVNPTVWFCMNNSIPQGDAFYLLNTRMTVMSKNYGYFLPSKNESVETIFAEGNSSYQRNDAYGQFNATYTWKTYFDPTSGYIIGYDYTEQDTSTLGNGFSFTDNLYINSASYSLTLAPSGNLNVLLIAAIVIIIVIILILIAVYAVSKRRLSKRSSQQPPATPPSKAPNATCPYCGGPIRFEEEENTTKCEYCGREVQKPPPAS